MIYFITENYLKNNTAFNNNIDMTKVEFLIPMAYDIVIVPLLGLYFSTYLLNKHQNKHTQWDLYKRFRDGELDRKGLMQIVNSENIKPIPQCELTLNKSKFQLMFKPSKELSKKGKYLEYERFAKEKLENLQKELQEKERELLK